jgi:hypothetical protein
MMIGGISIKAIKLIVAILGLSLLLVACGSATAHGGTSMPYGNAYYEGQSSYGHHDDNLNHNDQSWNHNDRNWNHNGYDWLSPGGYYWYPTTYYYNSYYTPYYTNTYHPTYYYTEPVYNTPVVYHDWGMDPWWGANVYGFDSTYYYGSSHWTYNRGFGDP